MGVLAKKSTRTVLQVLIIALVLASLGLMVYTMVIYKDVFAKKFINILPGTVIIFTLLCAALYAAFGFKKYARVFYYMFMALVLLAQLCSAYFFYKQLAPVQIVICLIAFGATSVLAFAMDLGLQKSLVLCGITVVSAINGLIVVIVNQGKAYLLYPMIVYCVLAVFILLVVLAKYADKSARGTE